MHETDVEDLEEPTTTPAGVPVVLVPLSVIQQVQRGRPQQVETSVAFSDYATVVTRDPKLPGDRYGLVSALKPGPVLLVHGVGKLRQEAAATITRLEKRILPGTAPRIQRLRLRLFLTASVPQ